MQPRASLINAEAAGEGTELHEAEEVLVVVFPSGDEAAEGVQPGEEPLYFPASAVATQFPSILSLAAPLTIGRDHFDVVLFGELLVEIVRVVGFVADEPGREFVEEASGKNLFHKPALSWRSAVDPTRERQLNVSAS